MHSLLGLFSVFVSVPVSSAATECLIGPTPRTTRPSFEACQYAILSMVATYPGVPQHFSDHAGPELFKLPYLWGEKGKCVTQLRYPTDDRRVDTFALDTLDDVIWDIYEECIAEGIWQGGQTLVGPLKIITLTVFWWPPRPEGDFGSSVNYTAPRVAED